MAADQLGPDRADRRIGEARQGGGERAGRQLHVVVEKQDEGRLGELQRRVGAAQEADIVLEAQDPRAAHVAPEMARLVGRTGIDDDQLDRARESGPQAAERPHGQREAVVHDHQHAQRGRIVVGEVDRRPPVAGQQRAGVGDE